MAQIDLIAFEQGDPSVGIQHSTWTIENIGDLDAYEGQREEVRKFFKDAFLTLADNITIKFSDELPTEPD